MIISEKIISDICLETGISEKALKSKRKDRKLANIRYICYKKIKENGHTLEFIGKMLNRNHSTVYHGLCQYEILKDYSDFQELERKCNF